jgi:hypothetical protein
VIRGPLVFVPAPTLDDRARLAVESQDGSGDVVTAELGVQGRALDLPGDEVDPRGSWVAPGASSQDAEGNARSETVTAVLTQSPPAVSTRSESHPRQGLANEVRPG